MNSTDNKITGPSNGSRGIITPTFDIQARATCARFSQLVAARIKPPTKQQYNS